MDDYQVHDGLDQCEVKRQESLCAKTDRIENQGSLTFFLAANVFMDDTIWVRSSQTATQYILNTASKFFRINNISINNEKTVAILINQKISNALLSISGLLISIAYRKESHQYLGIYLSSEGLSKLSLAKAHMNVKFFVNLVLKKAISDKQFLYLVSAVLQLINNYRTQFSFVSRNVCMKWDTLIRRGLRLKAGLLRDFPNEALHHLSLYGLRSFEQLQTECKMASVLCFSNADGILGHLFNHRSLDLQVLGWSPIHPLCYPIRLCVSPVNNFLAEVIRIFLDCSMSLGNLSTPISAVLGASLFYDVSLSLRKFEVAFRLDPRGPVSHWFTLIYSWDMNVCSLGAVFELSHCLSSANMKVVNVYTDRSLRDLGSREMKCGAAAYFSNLNMSIGAKVGELVSLTMVELQVIALALECVPPDSSVVVYSNSQAALDACVAESALVSLDFCNHCWMEQCGIVNLIRDKQLVVSWHKVKGHLGVVDNEHADKLAGLAVSSSLVLSVLVRERFIMATEKAVSENVRHFACEIFRAINQTHWEVGSGFNVVDDSLLGNVNWFHTASVWHPDSHMAASFISKSMAGLYSYFLKTFYCHLLVAV
ncbi:hypothetical protein G9A89_009994 [Geosiphon pyriformis]|nr:hypothetical protein G9A89_009994 [Geosiphon pyriformis]